MSGVADDLARLNRALDHIADPGRSRHELRVLGLDPEQLVPRHAAVEDERGTSARPAAPRAAPPSRAADEGRAARAVASAALPAPQTASKAWGSWLDVEAARAERVAGNPIPAYRRNAALARLIRWILYGVAWTGFCGPCYDDAMAEQRAAADPDPDWPNDYALEVDR